MNSTFTFDPQKSALNVKQHGIDFEKAQTLWINKVVEIPAKTEDGEIRYANIGKIGNNYWTAIITYRGAVRRIISVYPSSPRQIEFYERPKESAI